MPHPRKIPVERLTALITRATEGNRGLLLTDRQLLHVMNKTMKRCDRICYRTFQRYKAAAMAYGEATVEEREMFDPTYADLHDALMDNEINQKLALYEKMLHAEGKEARDYRWIMERKFPDLNMRLQTQKELADYRTLQQADMDVYMEEIAQQRQHEENERRFSTKRAVPAIAHTEEAATLMPEATTTEQKLTPSATAGLPQATPNYADLWKRPDGSRRTKEEFLRAVKMVKSLEG